MQIYFTLIHSWRLFLVFSQIYRGVFGWFACGDEKSWSRQPRDFTILCHWKYLLGRQQQGQWSRALRNDL